MQATTDPVVNTAEPVLYYRFVKKLPELADSLARRGHLDLGETAPDWNLLIVLPVFGQYADHRRHAERFVVGQTLAFEVNAI